MSDITITFISQESNSSNSKYPRQNKSKYNVQSKEVPIKEADTSQTSQVTRSGRVVKQPTRYEPIERTIDDYNESEYDSDSAEE